MCAVSAAGHKYVPRHAACCWSPCVSAYSQSDGHTCVMVAVEGRLAAAVSLFDPIKSEARGVVTALHTAGLQCHLLTGDNRCERCLLIIVAGWLDVLLLAVTVPSVCMCCKQQDCWGWSLTHYGHT